MQLGIGQDDFGWLIATPWAATAQDKRATPGNEDAVLACGAVEWEA